MSKRLRDKRGKDTGRAAELQALQYVCFRLGDEEYAIEILNVREVIKFLAIRHIPRSPAFVEGIIDLRNMVIPVIDLRKRFDIENAGITNETRIIIITLEERSVGLIVDCVSRVLRLEMKSIEKPSSSIASYMETDFISGLFKHEGKLVIIMDIEKILSTTEKAELIELRT